MVPSEAQEQIGYAIATMDIIIGPGHAEEILALKGEVFPVYGLKDAPNSRFTVLRGHAHLTIYADEFKLLSPLELLARQGGDAKL